MRSNIGAAPGGPHIPFHSPPLRRLLASWSAEASGSRPAPPAAAGLDAGVAERLGQWLAWTDAVELSAALNLAPAADAVAAAGVPSASVLAQALARLQADQARQITTDPVTLPGNTLAGHGADDDTAPYRRAAQARQRAMAAAVPPLRARLRAALAAASPDLARLAALDATLEAALAGRERSALAGVVVQIERRAQALRASGASNANDWRTRFHHDMQQALLAELQLRLEPLHGLLDALREAQPA